MFCGECNRGDRIRDLFLIFVLGDLVFFCFFVFFFLFLLLSFSDLFFEVEVVDLAVMWSFFFTNRFSGRLFVFNEREFDFGEEVFVIIIGFIFIFFFFIEFFRLEDKEFLVNDGGRVIFFKFRLGSIFFIDSILFILFGFIFE